MTVLFLHCHSSVSLSFIIAMLVAIIIIGSSDDGGGAGIETTTIMKDWKSVLFKIKHYYSYW